VTPPDNSCELLLLAGSGMQRKIAMPLAAWAF